jgi:hypothetical protein
MQLRSLAASAAYLCSLSEETVQPIITHCAVSLRHGYLSVSNSSTAATANSKPVMVVPYARLIPELRLQQLLRGAYDVGGGDLHAEVSERQIAAFTKGRNLGSFLVKASH